MAIRDFCQSRPGTQGVPRVVPTQGSYPVSTENSASVFVASGSGVLRRAFHESTLTNSVACLPNHP